MGVKFGREYEDIIHDLSEAMRQVEDVYDFLEMPKEDWDAMGLELQKDCIQTMADDVFFALGHEKKLKVGQGIITYEKNRHTILVDHGNDVVTVVKLV